MIWFNKLYFDANESFSQHLKTDNNNLLWAFNNKTRKENTYLRSLFSSECNSFINRINKAIMYFIDYPPLLILGMYYKYKRLFNISDLK